MLSVQELPTSIPYMHPDTIECQREVQIYGRVLFALYGSITLGSAIPVVMDLVFPFRTAFVFPAIVSPVS